MVAPSKISFKPPILRTQKQALALQSATTEGVIEEYQVLKRRVFAHFDYLRTGSPYPLSAAQLADLAALQSMQIAELNAEMENKLACMFFGGGPPVNLQPATHAAGNAQQATGSETSTQVHGTPVRIGL